MRGSAEVGTAEVIFNQPGVLAAIVLGAVVIGALGWLVAGGLGWSRTAAALAGAGLAIALAVTLVRPGVFSYGPSGDPLSACLSEPFSLHGTLNRLNFVMLMPFAFFATVASRRPIVVMVCCGVLSVGIEVFQAYAGIGVCETNDVFTNTVGGALAALAGWLCYAVFTGGRRARSA